MVINYPQNLSFTPKVRGKGVRGLVMQILEYMTPTAAPAAEEEKSYPLTRQTHSLGYTQIRLTNYHAIILFIG